MAKISSYPILSTPSINDLLIGTDVDNLNITKNFSIGDIASFIIGGSYVPYVGATENVDLGAFDITSSAFIIGGGIASQFLKADGSLDSTVYQPAGNYITQLSGEATASGPGNASVTLSNSAVINKVLTGLTVTGSVILPTDSILTAFGKVQNQINTLVGGVQYQGTWNADTNTPTLTSSVGVQGHYYVVSVPGSTNLNGITDWKLGDWAIYNGTAWDKIDNTDAVISVNGQVGAVVLTTTNISEGTNLYFTNSRARTAINLTTTGNSGAATYNNTNGFFNIPEYTLAGLGGVPLTRQLTINGTTFDLSANRSWNVGTVTSVGTSGPLTGGTITGSGTIGITQAGISTDGYLSSTDWNTFNNKQNAITNPVTGTGTAFFLPMWASASSLINSPLSYASDAFTFGYNSTTGGTVNFTNSGLTTYTYSIQMNNFGSPRSTVHSYTDGIVVQSIGGTQVSRIFANGNTIFGIGLVDNGNKLDIEGSVKVNTIDNATTDTDRFLVSDSGVIKYRTGTELRSDIGAGVGSVTSVGLTMPSAFSVANSPITSSGTLAVTGAGVASQYVRGDGTLADFPTTTGGGSSVSYYLNGSVSQGTIGGVAYRELSETPIFGAGTDISIAADGYIASFITDAGDPSLLNIPAGNWNFETYFSASSGGGTPSFYVELYRYDGTTFTLIASSSGTPELISFGTNIQPYFSTLAVPQTALALTDRLAIRYYVVTSGRTITLHTEDNNLCQVVTTFSHGLTALNGLTEQVQYFQVGTAGTDFNILSSVATHTFNIPDASTSARGVVTTGSQNFAGNKSFQNTIFANAGVRLDQNGTALPTFVQNISGTGLITSGANGLGFNGANNFYFSGSDKGGAIMAVNNTAARTYTLQDANGTLAFTSDLTGYVTLGTAQTITAQKTFTTSGSSDTMIISHGSGSGIALNITKAGNGEGIRVTKTSGTGNAVTISGGNFEAGTIVKTGGTSDQYLKADGSVSTLTNPVTGTGAQGRVAYWDSTGVIKSDSLFQWNDTFKRLGIGRTPTVSLAVQGAAVISNEIKLESTAGDGLRIYGSSGTNQWDMYLNGTNLRFSDNTGTGSIVFDRPLNGTSATFSSSVTAGGDIVRTSSNVGGINEIAVINSATSGTSSSRVRILTAFNGGTTLGDAITLYSDNNNFNWSTGSGVTTSRDYVIANHFTLGTNVFLRLAASTGAATFSSSVTTGGRVHLIAGNNTASVRLQNNAANKVWELNPSNPDVSNSGFTIWNVTDNTKPFHITDSGNVGIGTASPTYKFVVSNGGAEGIEFDTGSIFAGKNYLINYNRSTSSFTDFQIDAKNIYFGTDGTERMRITSGGDLHIGSSNVTALNTSLYFFKSSGLLTQVFAYSSGTAVIQEFYRQSGTQIGSISYNGSATLYNSTSDYRLKEDLKDFNGLEIVSKLKTYDFNWKDADTRDYGMIAHELQEVLPNYVSGEKDVVDKEGNIKPQGVDYSKIVPVLIKAIQELKTEIDSLKNQIK